MPKLNLNVSAISFLPLLIVSDKEKFNGPTGVKKLTAIPIADLIVLSSAKDEL